MDPEVSMPHDTMSGDYELKKNYDKALQEYQRSLTLGGDRSFRCYGTSLRCQRVRKRIEKPS